MSTIRTEGLTVAYGELLALEDVSICVTPGLTVVVGVNGSGKSSLLGAITGSVRPAAGRVMIGELSGAHARAQGTVAYVPQADAVDRDFPVTVSDVVHMGTYTANSSKAARRAVVSAAIARVGLTGLERRQIGELSGGQRRRVLLARALAQDAQVLIMDEPEAGIDAGTRTAFYAMLGEFVSEGRTILMATHDLAAVPHLASHAIVLHRRLIAEGVPADVLTPEVLSRAFEVPT